MTDTKAQRKAADADKAARTNDRDTIVNLMSTTQGRKWLWAQLSFCGIFHALDISDHAYMAWKEGQRNYGLKLLASINKHSPAMYIRMLQENSGIVEESEEPLNTQEEESNG